MKEKTKTINVKAPSGDQDLTTGVKVRIRLNGEMFVFWSFVVVCFAALFVAGCILWAKCNGR